MRAAARCAIYLKISGGKTPHMVWQKFMNAFTDYKIITQGAVLVTISTRCAADRLRLSAENQVFNEDLGIFTIDISVWIVYNECTVVKSAKKWYAVPKLLQNSPKTQFRHYFQTGRWTACRRKTSAKACLTVCLRARSIKQWT